MRTGVIVVAVALGVACEAPVQQMPPARPAGVRVVDLIPRPLYAGIMKVPGFPLNELKAEDFLSATTMRLQASRSDIDQPFVRTSAVENADRVYVGLNDFEAPDGRSATVDVSLDGGA